MQRKLIKINRAPRTLMENSLKMFFPPEKFQSTTKYTEYIESEQQYQHNFTNVNAKIKKKRPQNAAPTGKRREKIDFW